jgi:hypothetical protein
MDLTPLITDPGLSPWRHVSGFLDRFGSDVEARLGKLQGGEGSK